MDTVHVLRAAFVDVPADERVGFDATFEPENHGVSSEDSVPGTYRVRLTVGGVTQTQSLRVIIDPRAHVSPVVLAGQLATAKKIWNAMADADALTRAVGDSAMNSVHADEIASGLAKLMTMVESADRQAPARVLDALADFQSQLTVARNKLRAQITPRRPP